MSSSAMFVGAGFYVASASQVTPGTVRVLYSSAPKASNPAGPNDALNPANYALSGPGPSSISTVQPVSGNALAFDIVLTAPLAVGTWTVQVSNVQTPASAALTAPTAAQFQVTSAASLTPLAGGAENDDSEKIIRKHLSSALKGPNWDALIKGLSTGDDTNWENAQLAFDQLYLSTASGLYLERRASDIGLTKPVNVGINDDLFRRLAIKTSSNKLVHEAIREILEVFYGQDSLRAFVECEVDEKYNLTGEPELSWTLDEKETFTHTFLAAEFSSVAAAKAVEVAVALTKTMQDLGSDGFAIPFQSSVTGGWRVRIYSGSLGLGSFVRVTGGRAQNVFKFPSEISTYSGTVTGVLGYNWAYSRPDQNTTRASLTINTGTTSVLIDLSGVREGDYVIIGDDAGIGQQGTFAIKQVQISWAGANFTQSFDIEQISFNAVALQASNSAYRFYRPTKNSIAAAGGRTVVVAQTRPGHVDISIPVTTQAVSRSPRHAAYARVQPELEVARLQRLPSGVVNVFTVAGHGLVSGDVGKQIQLDNILPASTRPFTTPSNGSTFPASFTLAASHISLAAATQLPPSLTTENGTATVLTNGQVLFAGGYRIVAGAYDGAKFHTNRYQAGASALVIDGTEADGATQHTHTWIATANLNVARQYNTTTAYNTGALTTGGLLISPFTILASAEQYFLDGLWVNLAPMALGRAGHGQLELSGELRVYGGAKTEGTATNTVESFNGTAWSAGTPMLFPRTDAQILRLSDGRVMAIGGRIMGRGHDIDINTLGLWRLDESAGPTAADATGTYPLTYTNTPIVSPQGKINNCLDFNNSNSHLTGAGNAAAIAALLGEWTLECWFKRTTNAAAQFASYTGSTEGTANDNALLKAGIDTTDHLYWKWENGTGSDVTATMTATLASLPAYRPSFFNHLAVRKSLNGLAYTGKTLGWVVGDLIHGMTSGARAYITSVDGGAPGGASGTIRLLTANHLRFQSGENLVRIPLNQIVVPVVELATAAVAGASLYDVTIFVNGIAYQTWTGQANATGGSAAAWYIARDPKIAGSGFQGFLDDVRVSKRARDDGEIRQAFHQGWGNHQSPHGDQAVGELTATVEIESGGVWTETGQMGLARAYHRAILLPGDFVLVTGGIGYDPGNLPAYNDVDTSIWPSQSLRQAEIWDPVTGRWSFLQSAGIHRHGHVASYLVANNEVVLTGGRSNLFNGLSDDTAWVDVLNLDTRTWRTAPSKLVEPRAMVCGGMAGTDIVLMGGNDGLVTNPNPEVFIRGGASVSSGGLNGQFRIMAVPSGTQIQLQSTSVAEQQQYTSTLGPTYPAMAETLAFWNIATGSRTSNLTTLILSFPAGVTAHSILVGDIVYVNSKTGAFGAGMKTVLAVTSTGFSYAETASNQGSIAVVGSVSENHAPDAVATPMSALATSVNDPGPYVYDPYAGLAVTNVDALTTGFELFANQQHEEVEIGTGGEEFPDATGYIVLGFGHSSETRPIKYLGKYKSGPTTTRLILDYNYRFLSNFPIGSTVTLLKQREAFVPEDPAEAGSFYVTASSAGRVSAQAAAEAALAAGVNPDVTIVYPGDRGLGGEGLPAVGVQKLSDKVGVFAGDDVSAEVQTRRDE